MSEIVLGCEKGGVVSKLGGGEACVTLSVGKDMGADVAFCLSADLSELGALVGHALTSGLFVLGGWSQDFCFVGRFVDGLGEDVDGVGNVEAHEVKDLGLILKVALEFGLVADAERFGDEAGCGWG